MWSNMTTKKFCFVCEKPLTKPQRTKGAKYCGAKCRDDNGTTMIQGKSAKMYQKDYSRKDMRERSQAFRDARDGCPDAQAYIRNLTYYGDTEGTIGLLKGSGYATVEEALKNMERF